MVETSSSTENRKFDFVGISYKLACYVPIPFWILVYNLNLLSVLFPAYKGKDLTNPLLFIPSVALIVAVAIKSICEYVFLRIEKVRHPEENYYKEIPLNDLLFESIKKKSYGKLCLIVILWASKFIGIAIVTTMIFGGFIAFKYIRN